MWTGYTSINENFNAAPDQPANQVPAAEIPNVPCAAPWAAPNLAAPDQAVPEQDTDTSTIYWPAPEVPGAPASQPDQCADGPGDGAPWIEVKPGRLKLSTLTPHPTVGMVTPSKKRKFENTGKEDLHLLFKGGELSNVKGRLAVYDITNFCAQETSRTNGTEEDRGGLGILNSGQNWEEVIGPGKRSQGGFSQSMEVLETSPDAGRGMN